MLSFPLLLTIVLLSACDSPPKEAPQPAGAPAQVGTRTAEPEAKVVPPRAVPVEVKDAVGEPAGAPAPAEPPTEAAPADGANAAPAGGGDAAAVEASPAAKAERSSPEASTARKAGEGRPVKAFTDCSRTEAFADGHCYSSRDTACEALGCTGKCVQLRSMPAQVSCG